MTDMKIENLRKRSETLKNCNKLNARDIYRKGSDFFLQGHDFLPCRSKYNAHCAVNLTNQCAQCAMYINCFCMEQLFYMTFF